MTARWIIVYILLFLCLINNKTFAINADIYWKEKETHIVNFLTSDLYWKHYFSQFQPFIPINTNN